MHDGTIFVRVCSVFHVTWIIGDDLNPRQRAARARELRQKISQECSMMGQECGSTLSLPMPVLNHLEDFVKNGSPSLA